jgi:hypothetical protein
LIIMLSIEGTRANHANHTASDHNLEKGGADWN